MGGPQGALSSEGRDAALLCGCRVAVGLKKILRALTSRFELPLAVNLGSCRGVEGQVA